MKRAQKKFRHRSARIFQESCAVAKFLIIYVPLGSKWRGGEEKREAKKHIIIIFHGVFHYDFHEYHVNLIYPAKGERKANPPHTRNSVNFHATGDMTTVPNESEKKGRRTAT